MTREARDDRDSGEVTDRLLAGIPGQDPIGDSGPEVIRRTASGWRVHGGGEELPDLLNAMVLADLLLAEEGPTRPAATPPKAPEQATDEERLRVTVTQLEHALHTRVVVEQAIGVLAERHRITPRKAFERLRSAARSRGRKVADLARDVITSCNNPLTALPEELARVGAAAEAGPARRRPN